MTKQFESINDLINDSYFRLRVVENLSELRKNRAKRPNPKPGYYYKRDWYDRMIDESILNSHYFLDNIADIWNKKSSICSVYRQIIKFVCDKSAAETILKYSKEDEK